MTEQEIYDIYLEYARTYRSSGKVPIELYEKLYYQTQAAEYMRKHHELANETWRRANEEYNAYAN